LQLCPQWLATHDGWPLVTAGQGIPHPEQLFTSVAVLLHAPLHRVGWLDGHPDVQAKAVPPSSVMAQTGVPPLHDVVQLPQLLAVDSSASQPLSGLPSQSA